MYSFFVFWLLCNLILLLSYAILLASLQLAKNSSESMRKQLLLLLRRLDIHEFDSEIYDNAKQNYEEENNKKIDLISNLNEYGIFLLVRGLQNSEYVKLPT